MKRRAFLWICVLLTLALIGSAGGQEKAAPAYLRVLLPDKDADLYIDEYECKQTGKIRIFVTPPLPPGKTFKYTLEASWEPNNYTEVTRTREVEVQAGKVIEVDMREEDPKNPDDLEIKYVPTPNEVVEAMCKLADVGKADVVYDLGCGDGRIVITSVDKFKAKKGVGIDINEDLVKLSTNNAKKAKVADRVTFRKQDVLTIKEKELSDATVVMLYMGEKVNQRLMPVLKKALKPGARIVSHDFPMGDWKADKTVKVTDDQKEDHTLYLWTIKKK